MSDQATTAIPPTVVAIRVAILGIHEPRRSGNNKAVVCAEDGMPWPCATVDAVGGPA